MKTLLTLALLALPALAEVPRVDLSTYRTPAGTLQALYTAHAGPGPFILLDTAKAPGACFLGPNRWAVPVPPAGLPVLRFRLGQELHMSLPVRAGGVK